MKRFASVIVALASVALLASCSWSPLGWFSKGSAELSWEKAVEVVDALNAQDAAALKAMFTEYARTEYSAEIDDGLEYLLSLFPDGDVVMQERPTSSGEHKNLEGGKKTILTGGTFGVSSGGKDYDLSIALFTVNTVDPDNVGIFQISVVPRSDLRDSALEMAQNTWGGAMDMDARAGGPRGSSWATTVGCRATGQPRSLTR